MAFHTTNLIGNNAPQRLILTDAITEGSLHSLMVRNPTDLDLSISLLMDGQVVLPDLPLASGDMFTLPKPMNIPPSTELAIHAGNGLAVTCSYFTQPVDASAVLTSTQDLKNAVDATATAAVSAIENAIGSLPEGTIADELVSPSHAWSSKKIKDDVVGRITEVTENHQARVSETCVVRVAGITITLPTSPEIGDRVHIWVGDFIDTVVVPGVANILGQQGTILVDIPNVGVTFVYLDHAEGWRAY